MKCKNITHGCFYSIKLHLTTNQSHVTKYEHILVSWSFVFILVFAFWDRVSLRIPCWPQNHYEVQTGLEFMVMLLPQSLRCWANRCETPSRYLCVYTHMRMCVWRGAFAHLYACMWRPEGLCQCLSRLLCTLSFEIGLLSNLGRLTGWEPEGSSLLPQHWDHRHVQPCFSCGWWDLDSGSHVCTASTLLTEPLEYFQCSK